MEIQSLILWGVIIYILYKFIFKNKSSDHEIYTKIPSPKHSYSNTKDNVITKKYTENKPLTRPIIKEHHKTIRKRSAKELFQNEYISYTRINTFRMCPRMFELIYLCDYEDKSGPAAQKGSLIHKMIELYKMNRMSNFSSDMNSPHVQNLILSYFDCI